MPRATVPSSDNVLGSKKTRASSSSESCTYKTLDKWKGGGVVWCGMLWCSVGWCVVLYGGEMWLGVVNVLWGGIVRCVVLCCGVGWDDPLELHQNIFQITARVTPWKP